MVWRVELPYNDYFEYYGPDFKLHISPSNMANQNTTDYIDKIKTRLFENLRMLPHAPGVQMHGQCHRLTHIYLDTVPPADVVWNYVATDKLTTQDGDKFRTVAAVLADVIIHCTA